jgi:hypothetical protein
MNPVTVGYLVAAVVGAANWVAVTPPERLAWWLFWRRGWSVALLVLSVLLAAATGVGAAIAGQHAGWAPTKNAAVNYGLAAVLGDALLRADVRSPQATGPRQSLLAVARRALERWLNHVAARGIQRWTAGLDGDELVTEVLNAVTPVPGRIQSTADRTRAKVLGTSVATFRNSSGDAREGARAVLRGVLQDHYAENFRVRAGGRP